MDEDRKRQDNQDIETEQLDVDPRKLMHAPNEDAPPISPLDTASMPRAEDDAESMAKSPEFNDARASGKHGDKLS